MQRHASSSYSGPRLLRVAGARDLGLLFVHNGLRMIGQDCAYSIPLPGEKALWLFGDTLVGSIDEYGRRVVDSMPCNTALIAERGLEGYQYLTAADGALRQVIPSLLEEDPDRYRIWPLHGLYAAGRVYVYYLRVELLPGERCRTSSPSTGRGWLWQNFRRCLFVGLPARIRLCGGEQMSLATVRRCCWCPRNSWSISMALSCAIGRTIALWHAWRSAGSRSPRHTNIWWAPGPNGLTNGGGRSP